eukprot:scaffold6283_cov127-Isochrysis_galbana.AAC.1
MEGRPPDPLSSAAQHVPTATSDWGHDVSLETRDWPRLSASLASRYRVTKPNTWPHYPLAPATLHTHPPTPVQCAVEALAD